MASTINHLTGRARLWVTSKWEQRTPACTSFQAFATEFQKVFGLASQGPDSTGSLLNLFSSIDFHTQVLQNNLKVKAQHDAYLLVLGSYVKDELVWSSHFSAFTKKGFPNSRQSTAWTW